MFVFCLQKRGTFEMQFHFRVDLTLKTPSSHLKKIPLLITYSFIEC